MEACKQRIKRAVRELSFDPVLLAALAAAAVSAQFVPPSKKYLGYLDIRVLCLLLSLMLTVAGLQKAGVFGYLIRRLLEKVHTTRALAAVLIGICFFSSMFITNDVALITFVPLGILLFTQIQQEKLLIPVIVLQTVAANLGSMLTPLGNPQNLYLYSLSGMTVRQFVGVMAVPSVLSFLLLAAASLLIRPEPVEVLPQSGEGPPEVRKTLLWSVLFLFCLLAVLHIVPYGAALTAVLAGGLLFDREVLFRADYGLLLTFVLLFLFIGNIRSIPAINQSLSALVGGRELSVGILLSQVISNVPAAMLLSKFTADDASLLLGVNLGGLGTLIASMASVISYKLYAATEGARPRRYLAVFTGVNLLFLGILWGTVAVYTSMG